MGVLKLGFFNWSGLSSTQDSILFSLSASILSTHQDARIVTIYNLWSWQDENTIVEFSTRSVLDFARAKRMSEWMRKIKSGPLRSRLKIKWKNFKWYVFI